MGIIIALVGVAVGFYLLSQVTSTASSTAEASSDPGQSTKSPVDISDTGQSLGDDPAINDVTTTQSVGPLGSDMNMAPNNYTTDDVIAKVSPIIQSFEGFSAKAYPDPPGSGKYSIGYGHSIRPQDPYNANSVIGDVEALAILKIDLVTAFTCVSQNVAVPLNLNQACALTSFVFNEGCGCTGCPDPLGFKGSTMLKKLNAGDYQGAADEFPRWVKAGGQVNDTLVSRRQQEQSIFLG